MNDEEIEEAALASAANMGSPQFDRIVADDENGRTLLMQGDRVVMIIEETFEYITAYIRHNFTGSRG